MARIKSLHAISDLVNEIRQLNLTFMNASSVCRWCFPLKYQCLSSARFSLHPLFLRLCLCSGVCGSTRIKIGLLIEHSCFIGFNFSLRYPQQWSWRREIEFRERNDKLKVGREDQVKLLCHDRAVGIVKSLIEFWVI